MNDLEDFVRNKKHRMIHKFEHYLKIYDTHFGRFRNTSPIVVEIGVGGGGSLEMWKDYFGPGAQIYGIDNSPGVAIKDIEQEGIKILIGDQGNWEFMKSLPKLIGRPIDILIDDGSHENIDQILTLAATWEDMAADGVYLCEDIQTSYFETFGGGYKNPNSFIEHMKGRLDELNASLAGGAVGPAGILPKTTFSRYVESVHFYPGVVVIEKQVMDYILKSPLMIDNSKIGDQ